MKTKKIKIVKCPKKEKNKIIKMGAEMQVFLLFAIITMIILLTLNIKFIADLH